MDWFIFVSGLGVVWLVFQVIGIRIRLSDAEDDVRSVKRTHDIEQMLRPDHNKLARIEARCDMQSAVSDLDHKLSQRIAALARALGWEYREAERSLPGWHRIKKGGA